MTGTRTPDECARHGERRSGVRARRHAGASCTSRRRSATGCIRIEQPITLDVSARSEGLELRDLEDGRRVLRRLSGLDWISLRLANVYGPRNLSGPLPTFFQRLTEGKPCFVMDTRRDFVFVDDLVAVAIKAIDGGGESGVYHVSSGPTCRSRSCSTRRSPHSTSSWTSLWRCGRAEPTTRRRSSSTRRRRSATSTGPRGHRSPKASAVPSRTTASSASRRRSRT